jgi:hypothetical protein
MMRLSKQPVIALAISYRLLVQSQVLRKVDRGTWTLLLTAIEEV